jgi:putative colanic acid biosynthesis glycosyltransferase
LPLFSIITITFNNRDGLVKTSASIQSQIYQTYEWIIIDGNSTDGTQIDFINYPTAIITSESDKGIYDAMNKGIEHATGDYIIFMNAGDVFANKNVLNDISKVCDTHPDFIYGDSLEDDHLKRARHHSKINWGMHTHHQAMLYARRSLEGVRYNLNYKIAADYDLTLRFLKAAQNIIYLPIPICIFEVGGVSQTNAKLGRDEQFISRQKNKSCSMIVNHTIRIGQIVRYVMRHYLPNMYWNLFRPH